MPEEMGLVLNLIPKVDEAGIRTIRAQIDAQLQKIKAIKLAEEKPGSTAATEAGLRAQLASIRAQKLGAPGIGGYTPPTEAKTEKLTKGLGALLKGDLKGLMAVGGGAGLGAAGGTAVFEGIKSILTKIFDIFVKSSPVLQRSLKMIQIGIMGMVRPFADTLGRIFMPISRFFMLWGRAIYKDYREKYKKYVGEGMNPMEASIRASVESFIDGIVGSFTGVIGGIDLGTNIFKIVDELVSAFIRALSNPSTMAGILLIGGLIVTALGVALLAAAVTFVLAMNTVAWMMAVAAQLGLTSAAPAFAAMGAGVAGMIGGAITVGLAALPVLVAAAVVVAGDWLYDEITKAMGWTQPPPGGPGPAPGIPGGMPGAPMWPWEAGFKWPWEGAVGGIVTRPTFGLIGEAGPEAVIPLSKMKNLGGGTIITNQITITGPIYGVNDLENTITRTLDRYMTNFERGR